MKSWVFRFLFLAFGFASILFISFRPLRKQGTESNISDSVQHWASEARDTVVNGDQMRKDQRLPDKPRYVAHLASVSSTQEDLDKALSSIEQITNRSEKANALRELAVRLRLNTGDATRYQALQTVIRSWASVDQTDAANFVLAMPAGAAQVGLASTVVMEWASSEPEDAAKWTMKNFTGDAQKSVISALSVAWTRQSPSDAANFAASLPAGPVQEAAVQIVMISLTSFAPEVAANWVGQFPESKLRDAAVQDLIIGWAGKDAAQAADWLQGLSSGSTRDAAVSAFVGIVCHTYPAVAAAWAESIAGESERLFEMESTARAWMDMDQTAARSWIENAAFPPDVKKRLLNTGG